MGDLVVDSSSEGVVDSVVVSVAGSVVCSFVDSFVGSVVTETSTEDEAITTTEVLLGKTALTTGVALLITEDESETM